MLPISYADAQPLLAALGGPVAPQAWRGALPITYHLGPGPAQVHLKLPFDWELAPLYNVIARLRGAELPDEWIVRGNHHDAWVNGADDPVSGMVAVMEEARALGELAQDRAGGRSARIVYAAWDGEEPGLLGSTEWVEASRRGAAQARGRLHQHRRQRPRLPRTPAARTRSSTSSTRWRATCTDPETKAMHGRASADARGAIRAAARPKHAKEARTRRTCASTRSAPAPTTRRSCSTSASRRSTSASAARTTDGIYHSIYD